MLNIEMYDRSSPYVKTRDNYVKTIKKKYATVTFRNTALNFFNYYYEVQSD